MFLGLVFWLNFVLATPVMVLLDTKTREIVALPNTLNELMKAVQ